MGNCIGKKSDVQRKQRRHSFSSTISSTQRPKQSPSTFLLESPANTSLEQHNIFLSHSSDVRETNNISNDNDENEKNVIQYSSPLTNDQLVSIHTSSTVSPVQLSSECKKLKSTKTVIVFSENHIKQPFTLMTNEQDITMGHLFRQGERHKQRK